MTARQLTEFITEQLSKIGVIKGSVFFKEMMKLIKDQLRNVGIIRGNGVISDTIKDISSSVFSIIDKELTK